MPRYPVPHARFYAGFCTSPLGHRPGAQALARDYGGGFQVGDEGFFELQEEPALALVQHSTDKVGEGG